MILLD